jgi:hypothetical protein
MYLVIELKNNKQLHISAPLTRDRVQLPPLQLLLTLESIHFLLHEGLASRLQVLVDLPRGQLAHGQRVLLQEVECVRANAALQPHLVPLQLARSLGARVLDEVALENLIAQRFSLLEEFD